MEISQEEIEKMVQKAVELVVDEGRDSYKDFDEKVIGAFQRGRFGDALPHALPEFGDQAAHLVYALAKDDELADFIDSLPYEEAILYLKNNVEDILDGLDLDSMTMKRFVHTRDRQAKRKREGHGPDATDMDRFVAQRRKAGR